MSFIPFFLDYTAAARLIRKIRPGQNDVGALEALADVLRKDINNIGYVYLSEIWNRTEKALPAANEAQEVELLNELLRASRWQVQRLHLSDPWA